MDTVNNGFGDLIDSYSRAQAIDDGVLIDVTQHSTNTGWKVPIALTAAVNAFFIDGENYKTADVWMLLWQARYFAQRRRDEAAFEFPFHYGGERYELHVRAAGDDNGELCVTIGLPDDF